MLWMRSRQTRHLLLSAALVGILGWIDPAQATTAIARNHGELAIAQSPATTYLARASRRRLNFRVGVRPSRYRLGAYSRGSCGTRQTLAPLVPQPQVQERLVGNKATVDKTTAARPVFFVHLPALSASMAKFTLKTEAKQKWASVEVKLTGQAGVVGIALPESAGELQVGQKYFWQLEVACDPTDPSNLATVGSWVERVPPVAGQAGATTLDTRLTALAEQGVWQDVLTAIALQRYQKPSDAAIAEDWAALMDAAGLPQFRQAAIAQIIKN
jgi:Domain of Unknown Function (DUF928)